MNKPEISVVMPAYNAANYIAESIQSLINQTYSDWELIVVNDGSTDNTVEIINKFTADSRIKLISQKNQGVSAARNSGINASRGNYISFLDADDIFMPDNLKLKLEAMKNVPDADYVYSDIIDCDSEMKEMKVEKGVPAEKINNAILTWQEENIPGLSSNIMVRNSAIKEKGIYFDVNLSNCADRYYKILVVSTCKGVYIPQALTKYRNTPGSMSKNVFLLEHDELYILDRIKEKNIIPEGNARAKIFAKVYLMLSGSWFKDAGKTAPAIKFAWKSFITYPAIIFKLSGKALSIPFKKG